MRRPGAKPYIRFARANVPMKDQDAAQPAKPARQPFAKVIKVIMT
jgi:hypothetical protein